MRNYILLLTFFVTMLFFFSVEEPEEIRYSVSEIVDARNHNSFDHNFDANSSDSSCLSMAAGMAYRAKTSNSGTTVHTLGDSLADNFMLSEIARQRQFFNGIPADVYILQEAYPEAKNAYASSDGGIHFGYFMFWETISVYGDLSVAGILAHEWAHRVQFHLGWNDYPGGHILYQELEADAFSGFYLALFKQEQWDNIHSYYLSVYSSGDTNFNSPDHHGSSWERLNSTYLGVRIANQVMQTGIAYTYHELHEIFMGEIVNNIAPRSEEIPEFQEIVYGGGLRQKGIVAPFP